MGVDYDFAGLVASLKLDQGETGQAIREREQAEDVARMREWRQEVIATVPNWPWAQWGNKPWADNVHFLIQSELKKWAPMRLADGRITPGDGMVLCGPSGCGKSTGIYAALSAAIKEIRTSVEQGGPFRGWGQVMWVTEAQLVLEASQRRSDLFRKSSSAGVLVLDELGLANGHVAPVGQSPVVMALLAERYDRGAATIATSGVPQRVLAEKYGTGAVRRLTHRAKVIDLFTQVK